MPATNPRSEAAPRPNFLAQRPDQRGIFGETLDQDRAGAVERGRRINDPLTRVDIPARHLLWGLVGAREKHLRQRFEAGFARDLSLGPPFRPIRQIEILEPRLAVGRIDRLLERGIEFSLAADAVEDRGATFFELAQIAQPLLERTQLGVVESAGRLLAIAGNKRNGRSAVEQRDSGSDLMLADIQFLGDA